MTADTLERYYKGCKQSDALFVSGAEGIEWGLVFDLAASAKKLEKANPIDWCCSPNHPPRDVRCGSGIENSLVNESRNPTLPLLGRYQPIIELAKSPIGGLVMALDVPERRVVAIRSLPVEGKVPSETLAQLLEAGRWVKGLDNPAVMAPLDVGTQEACCMRPFSTISRSPCAAFCG